MDQGLNQPWWIDVIKALVVITVCLLQAPKARNLLNRLKAAPKPAAKEAAKEKVAI